jgi:nucleoside-diphosphate kinase
MAGNRTLTIIKPDAFGSGKTGLIIALLEKAGFKVISSRVMRLTDAQASAFYAVHKERPFFTPLVRFMTSGKCMPIVLERADAVATLRKTIGATDPAEAEAGTVRKLYAESKERNAIHASDSDENADREAKFFFAESDLV